MASSGMYVKKTKVADICAGRIDYELLVRVINLWSTPDRTNAAEEGAIHMIFLDKERSAIQATIRKDLVPKFKDLIQEGSVYVVEMFMVAKNDGFFRSTRHRHKLNFMRSTSVFKIADNGEIPKNHYDFMSFEEILAQTDARKTVDVIGHVVERDVVKDTTINGKTCKVMDVNLEDLEGNRIHCTLWEEHAIKMHEFLDAHDPSLPVVTIIQHGKLRKFMGSMGVSNSFNGTKLLLNADIPEVAEYIGRMNDANVELTQGVSQISGPVVISLEDDLLQTPRMTIEQLIEATQKCFGTVLAWSCEIDMDLGWFYQACTQCASGIKFIGRQLYCEKCKMPRTAVPRYKVNLQVMDDTGSITFVLFDRVVAQIIGRTAQDLLDAMNNANGSSNYPNELDVFVNKRILFKVEVTDANLYRNWRGYTVKKLSMDEDIVKRFATLHGLSLGDGDDDSTQNQNAFRLDDNTGLDEFEGGESNINEEVIVYQPNMTPTSKATKTTSSDVPDVGASASKASSASAIAPLTTVTAKKSPAKTVKKRAAAARLSAAKELKFACVETEDPK